MARTQQQRRAETRARLLDAAGDLFATKGFHATSAEAVADAADRTTGALYDHFGGKGGLLVALLEQWMGETVAGLTATLPVEADLDGRLLALWDGVVGHEHGDSWLLLEFELWLHAVRDPEMGVVGAERFGLMRLGLAGGLADWSAEFGFDLPASAEEVAAQMIGLVIGLAFQHRIDPCAVPQQAVRAGLRRLLDLAAEPMGEVPGPSGPAAEPPRVDEEHG